MCAYFVLQVEIMMALEEKFDLTLDEEGKRQIRCINLPASMMHISVHPCLAQFQLA